MNDKLVYSSKYDSVDYQKVFKQNDTRFFIPILKQLGADNWRIFLSNAAVITEVKHYYLTGAELKIAAEIDASISDLMTTARLYTDGLYWNYNPNRMILNKVTDVYLCDNDEKRVELEDDKLYRVVTDFYTSQMLGGVTDLSYGLLSIVPKFADGTPVERYEDAVIMTTEGTELKAWAAIAEYMTSFEDTDGDGIGNVPAKYAKEEGRKVVEDSKKIGDLLKNPNKFFFIIIGLILVVLAILTGIIVLIVKVTKKIVKSCKAKKEE